VSLPEVNQAIKGTLGRAQRYYGLRVVACVFLSNHFHLLVLPDSEKQLADFMRFVKTNLSKQLGRIHGWSGPMLKRRYQAIPVSDEEKAQVDRLRYILEHGVKEGLVGCPADWPGVQCVLELTKGPSQLYGIWHERTAIWEAEQRGEELPKKERISRETMDLSPLPVWETRAAAKRDGDIREMVAEIEARGRELRGGSAPLGVWAILRQDPHSRP
jgi:REP element-mobilizing transposase RayT